MSTTHQSSQEPAMSDRTPQEAMGDKLAAIYNSHYQDAHDGATYQEGHSASEGGIGSVTVEGAGREKTEVPVFSILAEGEHYYVAVLHAGPITLDNMQPGRKFTDEVDIRCSTAQARLLHNLVGELMDPNGDPVTYAREDEWLPSELSTLAKLLGEARKNAPGQ